MSTSYPLGLNLTLLTLHTALPLLTGALQTSSVLSGLYFLLNPPEGAKLFGRPFKNDTSPTPSELAFTRIHGLRDVALGMLGLGLVNYAWRLEGSGHLEGATTVGRAVGLLLFVGVGNLVGDGWILGEWLAARGEIGEEEKSTAGEVLRHVGLAVPIGALGLGWLYYF